MRRPSELAPLVPPDRFLIAESGIRTTTTCGGWPRSGAQCFLVGESLMRQADVAAATRALLGDRHEPMSGFTHFDAAGNAAMVDVGGQAGDRPHRDGARPRGRCGRRRWR